MNRPDIDLKEYNNRVCVQAIILALYVMEKIKIMEMTNCRTVVIHTTARVT